MDEDNIYIQQFLNGDLTGFEVLVKKYQNRVLNIVYSLIGRDRESEDIVQEVFLKVHNSLQSFKYRCRFSTWLYRITVNATYDFLRKRKNFINDEGVMEKVIVSPDNPKETLAKKEREQTLKKALAQVPFKYKTAMILKDIEDLSYIEISKILKCSIGTVESRIYRARQCLRYELVRLEEDTI